MLRSPEMPRPLATRVRSRHRPDDAPWSHAGQIALTGAVRLHSAVLGVAQRLVRYWGQASVEAVVDRISVSTGSAITAEAAREILRAHSPTRWLDPEQQWFSFEAPRGRFEAELDKVFAICARVDLGDLYLALSRALPGVQSAPRTVLLRHLVGVARCTCDGVYARRAGWCPAPPPLTRTEVALVKLLDAAGGDLDVQTLRKRASAAGLAKSTLSELLRRSPLVLPVSRGRVRLIGRLRPVLDFGTSDSS
jgi:hypothetical protein